MPAAKLSMTALEKGDWRSVEDAHGNSEDWDTRGSVAAALRRLDPIDDWVLSCPRSGLAHAVRGSQLCRLAWDVRGNGKANTVDRSAWGDFFSLLRAAEESFGKAVDLEPRDPYPWSQLIWTGTGLQIPKDDVLGRFESMRRRDDGFVPGWLAITSAVAQKWSGSHTLMFDVAREGDRTLPDGNLGRVGLVRAHEEFRMYLAHWDNDPVAAKAHFRKPEVAAEIGAAASASVFSAHHEPGGSTPLAQSWFAYALAMVGDGVRAERVRAAGLFLELERVGIPDQPWANRYGRKGGEQFARIRRICCTAAGTTDEPTTSDPHP
ncbi:uncharacterized protein DUF4034 [Rudaeicoccus suwonensis]|uniref:Uncharacterized protein DUF4034 n=1 Tax=Rudaeicoccus suwonensis TaxID=657409 RepID=A0A561ECN0_9MICO|nr:uncharacterized protein DUF4034 [Rudaeicoccus suwonensis]